MDLLERVQEAIAEHALLKRGDSVIVAVSGGSDSVVLLDLLNRTGMYELMIAHFNHRLRGAESDGDEGFVAAFAEKLKLPFVSGRGDVTAHAEKNGISIEMAARELRHAFLAETAEGLEIRRVALAHHADDQVETFWLRLLRGDVGPGVAGMRWCRPARSGSATRVVRPLLEITKAEVLRYARENAISYREDASNASPKFLRNRLRLGVLGQLKLFQPELTEVTLRAAAVLRDEKDFLEKSARSWLDERKPAFDGLQVALQREIVRLQLLQLGIRPSFQLIELLCTDPGRAVSFSPVQSVLRSFEGFVSVIAHAPPAFGAGVFAVDLTAPGSLRIEEVDISWKFVATRGASGPGVEYFDADQVGPSARIRHWQPGDRFHQKGFPGEAKLQNLFTNLKLAPAEKRRRLVGTDANEIIFWVEGLRISEQHKVAGTTSRILSWSWRRNR